MNNNLNTLSILHYVYGGLICMLGTGVLLVMGTMGSIFQSDWFLQNTNDPPPPFVGALFSGIGWAIFGFLLVKGVANIISGTLLAKARGRIFSQIVAAVDCLNIPFGIALGIFTLVELNKPDVKGLYQA